MPCIGCSPVSRLCKRCRCSGHGDSGGRARVPVLLDDPVELLVVGVDEGGGGTMPDKAVAHVKLRIVANPTIDLALDGVSILDDVDDVRELGREVVDGEDLLVVELVPVQLLLLLGLLERGEEGLTPTKSRRVAPTGIGLKVFLGLMSPSP